MQETLWQQAVELMLFGMGTVFVFLTCLVIATTIMSRITLRFFKHEPVAAQPSAGSAPKAASDDTLIAVISAAIQKHRSRHKK